MHFYFLSIGYQMGTNQSKQFLGSQSVTNYLAPNWFAIGSQLVPNYKTFTFISIWLLFSLPLSSSLSSLLSKEMLGLDRNWSIFTLRRAPKKYLHFLSLLLFSRSYLNNNVVHSTVVAHCEWEHHPRELLAMPMQS